MSDQVIFPIQIRDDVICKVTIPHDLSRAEAVKICRVVTALVDLRDTPLSPKSPRSQIEEILADEIEPVANSLTGISYGNAVDRLTALFRGET